MNRFLALVRKDLADYRGALVITPLVVAAIILALSLVASLSGNFNPGFRFGEEATAEGGSRAHIQIDGEEAKIGGPGEMDNKTALAAVMVMGTLVAALLPLGIALGVIVFSFLGSLYDERKDRSILFWKSMPTSDLQAVLSKAFTIGGLGLGMAVLAGIVTHVGLSLLAFTTGASFGLGWLLGPGALGLMVQGWAFLAAAAFVYLLWALPVYAWLLFASAASPKAPILLGLVPFVLVPLAARVIGIYHENLLEPLGRLIGEPMWMLFSDLREESFVRDGVPHLSLGPLFAQLGDSFTQPGLYIGLLVAGALFYAAAEVRRRKAL
jgi:ABC-2 type transport system permease protein